MTILQPELTTQTDISDSVSIFLESQKQTIKWGERDETETIT